MLELQSMKQRRPMTC